MITHSCSTELKESLADLETQAEIKDDTISLLYQANKNIHVNMKTPFGLTDQLVVDEAVLQGEVWGSALASNQVDTFGKEITLTRGCLKVHG